MTKTLWEAEGVVRAVATGGSRLYLLNADESLSAIEADTGEEAWRLPLARGCLVTTNPSRSTIYVYNAKGAITALGELEMD